MNDGKRKGMCIGLCFALAGAMLTACGREEASGAEVRGRITSISEQEITLEIFRQLEGERSKGEKPDGKNVSGSAVGKMEKPAGTPSAGKSDEKAPDNVSGGATGKGNSLTESKTYSLSGSTKIYMQQGEEKTKVSLSDLELGSMVSVTASGDKADSITVQAGNKKQNENNR